MCLVLVLALNIQSHFTCVKTVMTQEAQCDLGPCKVGSHPLGLLSSGSPVSPCSIWMNDDAYETSLLYLGCCSDSCTFHFVGKL